MLVGGVWWMVCSVLHVSLLRSVVFDDGFEDEN